MSEIAITRCMIDPALGSNLCAPASTSEQDAIKGKWVRVDRNLNYQAGYLAGNVVRLLQSGIIISKMLTSHRISTIAARDDKISTSLMNSVCLAKARSRRNYHRNPGTKSRSHSELGYSEYHHFFCGTALGRP